MPPERCIALQTFGDVLQGNVALGYMQFAKVCGDLAWIAISGQCLACGKT